MMNIEKPAPDELPGLTTLVISSVLMLGVIAVLLVTVVLPAEKGIDPTGIGTRLHLTRMGVLKTEFQKPDAPLDNRPASSDQIEITLEPGEGREIKLEMLKGYQASYRWTTNGLPVNHDTHGDPYINESIYISYSKAESVTSEEGVINAPYGGYHGWYWVNKNDQPVTITLQARGEYLELVQK